MRISYTRKINSHDTLVTPRVTISRASGVPETKHFLLLSPPSLQISPIPHHQHRTTPHSER